MAGTPLTLAALATSAVPGLTITGTREHSRGSDGAFTSAVLVTADRDVIIRVPNTPAAEVQQSAELLGLSALTPGARETLPFAVPETLGMTRAQDTRAVVSTFVDGNRVSANDLADDALLLQPIAETLAAIHELPRSIVQQAGLTVQTAEDARETAARVVRRAADTRMLPETVHARWNEALSSTALWDFAPTVVHGSFDADQLLVSEDRVVGVLGWNELCIGDPAADLSWLLAAGRDVFESVLARYTLLRGGASVIDLRARARFTHELDVARWLLHGIDSHDERIVDDAIGMLDRLVDRLDRLGSPVPQAAQASTEVAERLLDERPEIPFDPRSDTAEYDALDEDRDFSVDSDFGDPAPSTPAGTGTDSGTGTVSGTGTASDLDDTGRIDDISR